MWQAISTLLRDWHTEDAEIELKTELPGGEIHSAWHLRFGGKDYFVKCDERELLPIFTAESDQLELLSRSKTVRVPQVFAVGSDRGYSFVVMEYLPPRPPRRSPTPGSVAGRFFLPSSVSAGSWSSRRRRDCTLAISIP